jgi:hypothetical protein
VPKQRIPDGWYLVNAPVAPRVASKYPPPCEHGTAQGAMPPHRLEAVVGARRVVLARRTNQRGNGELIHPNQTDKHKLWNPDNQSHDAHAATLARARRKPPTTSAFNSVNVEPEAAGSARTTTDDPDGRCSHSSAIMARKRRVTRLRTTAPPTARETAKPAMLLASPVFATYTTAVRVPALAPWRMTRRKSSLRRSRWLAASTTPTKRRDPYDDGPSKWSDRHGYACAGGSRAS